MSALEPHEADATPLAADRAALDKQRAHVEQQRRAIYDLLAALDRQGIVLENQRSALNRRAAAAVDELERTLRALSRSGELSDADRARLRAALEPPPPPPEPEPDEDRAAQAFVIPPEMSPPRVGKQLRKK